MYMAETIEFAITANFLKADEIVVVTNRSATNIPRDPTFKHYLNGGII